MNVLHSKLYSLRLLWKVKIVTIKKRNKDGIHLSWWSWKKKLFIKQVIMTQIETGIVTEMGWISFKAKAKQKQNFKVPPLHRYFKFTCVLGKTVLLKSFSAKARQVQKLIFIFISILASKMWCFIRTVFMWWLFQLIMMQIQKQKILYAYVDQR